VSKFVHQVKLTTPFDGDTVTALVRPMSFATALKFRELTEDKVRMENELPAFLQSALAEHLVSVEGLHDAGGNPIEKSVMVNSAYFLALVLELGRLWSEASMPGN
jgi:hypothetical protein